MKARFKLTRGGLTATFVFSWPTGGTSYDGTGTLALESGSRTALEEMTELAAKLEARDEPVIDVTPLPEITPPFLRKIDAISKLAFWKGWEWEWVGDRPKDLEDRYEPVPKDAIS